MEMKKKHSYNIRDVAAGQRQDEANNEKTLTAKNAQCVILEPNNLQFAHQRLGQLSARRVRLINRGSERLRFNILPLVSNNFRIGHYEKKSGLLPGDYQDITIECTATDWLYHQATLYIVTSLDNEQIMLPLHIYPAMQEQDLPRSINFGVCPIGECQVQSFSLQCTLPVSFEFALQLSTTTSTISVQPMSGTIPANGQITIEVLFTPVDYVTVSAWLQICIAQFNFEPTLVAITGSSMPGLLTDQLIKKQQVPLPALQPIPTKQPLQVNAQHQTTLSRKTKLQRIPIVPINGKTLAVASQVNASTKFLEQVRERTNYVHQKASHLIVCKGEPVSSTSKFDGQQCVQSNQESIDSLADFTAEPQLLSTSRISNSIEQLTQKFIPLSMAWAAEWEYKERLYSKLQQVAWKVVNNLRMMKRLELIKQGLASSTECN